MSVHKLLLLPGDGIGPEITAEAKKVLAFLNETGAARFETQTGLVAERLTTFIKQAISEADMELAQAADAVLLAAVGGPKWDGVPYEVRPEAGCCGWRKDLGLFANLASGDLLSRRSPEASS